MPTATRHYEGFLRLAMCADAWVRFTLFYTELPCQHMDDHEGYHSFLTAVDVCRGVGLYICHFTINNEVMPCSRRTGRL